MSNVSVDRSLRLQDIKKGLQFIQSTLPYPGTQEQYEVFIRDLVKNLFHEGNDAYQEGDWEGSLSHYSEALNIADYANSEGIHISDEVLEKLHVNRIACYSKKGLHDRVLEDCGIVLKLNENNFRALYRKSKALKELGRYREAYDAVAKCSLAVPQDDSVIKLTQELAQQLGLKIRKAYVRAKPSSNSVSGEALSKSSNSSIEDIESGPSALGKERMHHLQCRSPPDWGPPQDACPAFIHTILPAHWALFRSGAKPVIATAVFGSWGPAARAGESESVPPSGHVFSRKRLAGGAEPERSKSRASGALKGTRGGDAGRGESPPPPAAPRRGSAAPAQHAPEDLPGSGGGQEQGRPGEGSPPPGSSSPAGSALALQLSQPGAPTIRTRPSNSD
ncbi:zinc finger CCCH domain-containing protein 7A-like [Tiliqua scincoides]|uniref:zinc finger CCCH domain-containing protein 7A-like n=1 Tax=Tiliqua scincoides TaxID=71010 RepID=UPI003462C5B8